MAYFISMLIVLALTAGFFIVTWHETQRGVRFFTPWRSRLDQNVERIEFIFTHVDLGAFLREEVRRLAGSVTHGIAHFSLVVVRVAERLLTRLVRRLRTSQAVDPAPRENAREFVKTLSDFKDQLKATHPEISDIQE